MDQQSFVQGFLKKAEEHGFNANEQLTAAALASYDNLSKQAFIGPYADLMSLGLPSAAGAMIGSNYSPISTKELKDELEYTENPSISKTLKYLLIPGYTGYRAAKSNRLDRAYEKYQDEQNTQQ